MNLVIHVPHPSTRIPDELRGQFGISTAELANEAIEFADLHTDRLAREAWPDAEIVEAVVSRIVVDVERYSDDALEAMSAVGRGMIYTRAHDGRDLMRSVSAEARKTLKSRYYDPHWSRLRKAAAGCLLIDLHTYPTERWHVEPDVTADRPEIDLGATDGITPESWVEDLTRHFEDAGFNVGRNTPYVGVIDAGAHAAIMLEIRRDVLGSPRDEFLWDHMVQTLSEMPLPR